MNEFEEIRFRRELADSFQAAEAISRWICKSGRYKTELPPLKLRPEFEDRANYGDDHDLTAICTQTGIKKTIEVKWRNLKFISENSFPYKTIFVDRIIKADEKSPDIYCTVNKTLTHAAIISAETKPLWITATVFDKIKGHPLKVYECPKDVAVFRRIS